MKINVTSETLRPERLAPAGDARTAATRTQDPVAESESVKFSDLASRLSQLETQFGNADFDAKKVAEIRAAIAEGRFQVNPGAIADGLMSSVADLLGKR
jgi:negative regulator of flagellin synthesis FlgM